MESKGDLACRSIPNEAPPGLFFTKAAFLKYSALSRVKAARVRPPMRHTSYSRCLAALIVLYAYSPQYPDARHTAFCSSHTSSHWRREHQHAAFL